MKLRVLTKTELEHLYNTEMKAAFPPNELKPLSAMENLRDTGCYEPLGVFDGEELVGYALVWLQPGIPFALLDYLGTLAGKRGGGIGAKTLDLLAQRYAGTKGVFGESEAVTAADPAEAEMQRRRLAFYERCGFRYAGYDCALFGAHYRTLIRTECEVSAEEILQAHIAIYKNYMPAKVYSRFIQIPLAPGEKPFTPERWTEE
ncbi:MAG: GNAT family N-acetyltransferase [Oscillospiraceae bacterium]|nr:GNAT family N-acetyltransferase [Oscillospiraceae bacterium]